tara:strand:- start:43 stop:528 length:486 start_codon:yes stop_codon:yes gene_type:complete
MKKPNNFKEPTALNAVAEFHTTFNAPILKKAQIPAKERAELRISLLQEELNELKEAIAQNDLVEVADALCDLQYVLSGAILEFGMADKFKELFDEVQRSNMSKACTSKDVAEATVAHYEKRDGTKSTIEAKEDKFLVFRTPDNKVLKSVEYSPADLKTILK